MGVTSTIMSRWYAARIARLTASVLLLCAAGRLLFVYSTEEVAEYSRHAKQPEIYLSPWPDIARFSALALASVPLVILCSIRLVRGKTGRGDRAPSSFSFAADCAALYCLLSFLQHLLNPTFIDSTPITSVGFPQNLKDALLLSNFEGALGAYSGFVVALFLAPASRFRALVAIAIAAILTYVVSAYVLIQFRPPNPNVSFWFWMLNAPVSAFIGAAVFRLSLPSAEVRC